MFCRCHPKSQKTSSWSTQVYRHYIRPPLCCGQWTRRCIAARSRSRDLPMRTLLAAVFTVLLAMTGAVAQTGAADHNTHFTRAPYLTDLVGLHVIVNFATDQLRARPVRWSRSIPSSRAMTLKYEAAVIRLSPSSSAIMRARERGSGTGRDYAPSSPGVVPWSVCPAQTVVSYLGMVMNQHRGASSRRTRAEVAGVS